MLIGISGKMKAGKDTTADFLSYLFWCYENNCLDYMEFDYYLTKPTVFRCGHIHKFADLMKECLALCLGVPREQFESQEFKASNIYWLGMTVRELLQKFGTGIRDAVDQKFWVKTLLQKYDPSINNLWFITDVRFLTEVTGIIDKEGILIRVNKPSVENGDTHVSEVQLDDYKHWDYVIDNTEGLAELFYKCKDICLDIVSKQPQ